MPEPDWTQVFASLGPVGGTLLFVWWLLSKTGFAKGEDPTRGDINHKLEHAIRQLDGLDAKMDRMDRETTDRLARIETTHKDLSRRVERIEK